MSDVPSNLIPYRVTQLPTAPEASPEGILLYILNGVSYQIRAGDLLQVSGVPTTRQVIAGTGLSGGGQLSSNVTLSIAAGGVGDTELSNTGVTAGSYGSLNQIPVVQVNSKGRITSISAVSVNLGNKVDTSTQVIAGNGLTGGGALASNVTLAANVGSTIPLALSNLGSAGTSFELSRVDHRHPAVDLSSSTQTSGILPMNKGGTGSNLTNEPGGVVWSDSSGLKVGPVGMPGQVLVSGGSGSYAWGTALVQSAQPANYIYAGPASGPDDFSSFRLMVNADLPATLSNKAIENSPIGVGSASTVRGTTVTATTQFVGPGTGLTGTASALSIGGNAATSTTANTASSATTATKSSNLLGGGARRIAYQTSVDATDFIVEPSVSNTFLRYNGTDFDWQTISSGSVTSVAVSGGSTGLTTSGGPITSSGTITLAGTLNASSGGTGLSSYTAGDIVYATGTSTLAKLALGASGDVVVSSGSAPSYVAQSSLSVGTASIALKANEVGVTSEDVNATRYLTFVDTTTGQSAIKVDGSVTPLTYNPSTNTIAASITGNSATSTNIAGGSAGRVPYQSGVGVTAFVVNGTAGQVFVSQGSSAPGWANLDGGVF